MRRIVLIACAALVSCAAPKPLAPTRSFRAAEAPIGSAALFDVDRFVGKWRVVAEFPGAEGACGASVEWARIGPGFGRIRCAGGAEALALSGPGRFTGSGSAPIWILWVDSGYRTAVIGTPDGRFGRILNRGAEIPPDRYAAAREILDFNGYDLAELTRVTP